MAPNFVTLVDARAFFVFGDSLVDNGNNNYLATTARADSPPYGIDYPTGRATGRFSNGFNIPDLISCVSSVNSHAGYITIFESGADGRKPSCRCKFRFCRDWNPQ
ncbi:hypothetical protein ACFE04_023632 [Oxalis oulophora]